MPLYNPHINVKQTLPTKIHTYSVEKEGYNTFELNIEEYYINDMKCYYLYVDNTNKEKIIEITLHEKLDNTVGKHESHIAKILWVKHYETYELDYNLSKDNYDIKHLILCIFKFMKDNYKWISIIELDDNSYFISTQYNDTEERKVMVGSYNIILYGKTWYENNFNAYMNDYIIYNIYKESITQLDDPQQKIHWEQFKHDYKIDENIDVLEKYYTSSETYRELFIALKNDDNERYCWRISKWIQYFISDILESISIDIWYIDLDKIPEYDIKVKHIKTDIEKPYRGGSKKKTRRIKKLPKLPPGFNQTEFDLEYNDHWPYD